MEKRNNADNIGSKKRPAPKDDELIKPKKNITQDQVKSPPKQSFKDVRNKGM